MRFEAALPVHSPETVRPGIAAADDDDALPFCHDRLVCDGNPGDAFILLCQIFHREMHALEFTPGNREFTGLLQHNRVAISMDGRGRAMDNIFIERLWRSVKYEDIYLKAYATVADLIEGLERYFEFYDHDRIHQSLEYRTPYEVWHTSLTTKGARGAKRGGVGAILN